MPYPGEKPHVFVQVEPGTKWPEFCRDCGDLRTHPVHKTADVPWHDMRTPSEVAEEE